MNTSSLIFLATAVLVTFSYVAFLLAQRAFDKGYARGRKEERECHERVLEKLAYNRAGLVRKPGESIEEMRARYARFLASPTYASLANTRAALEDMKPIGMKLDEWVDRVLGRVS